MAAPFSAEPFFRDEFFLQNSVDASGMVSIVLEEGGAASAMACILHPGLDPQRKGALLTRGGFWAELTVLQRDYEDAFGVGATPKAHDTWTVDGTDFDVDSVDPMSGDSITVNALARQRSTIK